MLDGWDSYLKTLRGASFRAAVWLTRYRDVEEALEEKAQGAIRTSGVALQVSKGRRRWAPGRSSDPEAHVTRNQGLIARASRIRQTLANIPLDYLAAQVLYRHVWQNLELSRLAEFLDVREPDLDAARRRLVETVAAHLQATLEEAATEAAPQEPLAALAN